ncbi:uncharacterized protein LOC130698155 [Daphnia carinata]|uniref:uncharacterized protein LOC130698155 n=1 Tax=Daphnia carinata TaxID=120202 RepID=UPI00257F8AD1|nr:uncharacterized protein LOC130698155 [Daphnia carinata]
MVGFQACQQNSSSGLLLLAVTAAYLILLINGERLLRTGTAPSLGNRKSSTVDDDVYVNVWHISLKPITNPIKAYLGQWNNTVEERPWSQYPPYFFDPAVLMPGNTILSLLAACQTTPMMPFDDVYLTGMCTEKAGITVLKSFNSTSVLAIGLPGIPTACHVHHYIAWTAVSANHMNNSHVATNDFYGNETQCILHDASSGTNRTVDSTEFVHFYFH